jgi:hypothetical protein
VNGELCFIDIIEFFCVCPISESNLSASSPTKDICLEVQYGGLRELVLHFFELRVRMIAAKISLLILVSVLAIRWLWRRRWFRILWSVAFTLMIVLFLWETANALHLVPD